MERMINDENYYSYTYNWYSYLIRGIYIDQIKMWTNYFSTDRLLILFSEEFYEKTPDIFAKVQNFLGLPEWMPDRFKKNPPDTLKKKDSSKLWDYPNMDNTTRTKLGEYFKPYNEQLFNFLNKDFNW